MVQWQGDHAAGWCNTGILYRSPAFRLQHQFVLASRQSGTE